MKLFIDTNGSGRTPLSQLNFMQTKQAAAVMDAMGRIIPQEGVDYDVEITFRGGEHLSMAIVPLTEKGKFWQAYAMDMLKKYPPTIENPEMAIQEEDVEEETSSKKEEVVDAEVVS